MSSRPHQSAGLSGDGERLPHGERADLEHPAILPKVSQPQAAELLKVSVRTVAACPLLEPGEGSDLWLSLVSPDGSKVSLLLGAGELVALAAEMLAHARLRCGRQGWPPKPPVGPA